MQGQKYGFSIKEGSKYCKSLDKRPSTMQPFFLPEFWYLLGVLFKISDDHPGHFHMGVPPRGAYSLGISILNEIEFCIYPITFCVQDCKLFRSNVWNFFSCLLINQINNEPSQGAFGIRSYVSTENGQRIHLFFFF